MNQKGLICMRFSSWKYSTTERKTGSTSGKSGPGKIHVYYGTWKLVKLWICVLTSITTWKETGFFYSLQNHRQPCQLDWKKSLWTFSMLPTYTGSQGTLQNIQLLLADTELSWFFQQLSQTISQSYFKALISLWQLTFRTDTVSNNFSATERKTWSFPVYTSAMRNTTLRVN